MTDRLRITVECDRCHRPGTWPKDGSTYNRVTANEMRACIWLGTCSFHNGGTCRGRIIPMEIIDA